jgi:hypothetical protein
MDDQLARFRSGGINCLLQSIDASDSADNKVDTPLRNRYNTLLKFLKFIF